MNKIILLISIDGTYFGGAEKRYLTLFNYLSDKRKDYYLVVNKRLYLSLKKNSVLKSYDNVRILTLYGEKNFNHQNLQQQLDEDPQIIRQVRVSKIKLFLGMNKVFIKSLITWLAFAVEFRKVIKELSSKIVYAVWTGGHFAWPLRKIFNFNLIYSYNDSTVEMTSKSILEIFNHSDRWVLKKADKIDFLSPSIVSLYEKKLGKLDKSRISISPNSFIDYQRYFNVSEKEDNVIFLSRLFPYKNPMLFLQAVEIFNKCYPESSKINFYIIGEGDLEEDIKEYINSNNLINTHFIGSEPEPATYLKKSKIFVSLQKVNNYPSQSLIEAMACENAIIASDVGETRLLVTENEGILVDFNPQTIADAISKLFSTKGLIEKLGSNARKKVTENHTVEKYADYFYSLTNV